MGRTAKSAEEDVMTAGLVQSDYCDEQRRVTNAVVVPEMS